VQRPAEEEKMAAKKRGLGRGLDALLGAQTTTRGADDKHQLKDLPIEQIRPGKYQPRTGMDEDRLAELAASIRAQGIVQPIVVRPVKVGKDGARYEIIAGERRWRAAQKAGLRDIPTVIREIPDEAAVAMSLIENIQREDLNPLEEAQALQRLIDEFDMTHDAAADAVGRSRAMVSNLLRLIKLHAGVKKLLMARALEMGHARALLALSGSAQLDAATQVVKKDLTVRATEQFVRRLLAQGEHPAAPKAAPDPNIQRLESDLADRLGARVVFAHSNSGKGRMTIHYNSLDELDGILEKIR